MDQSYLQHCIFESGNRVNLLGYGCAHRPSLHQCMPLGGLDKKGKIEQIYAITFAFGVVVACVSFGEKFPFEW